jgi:hypothetical protein
MTRTRRRLGQPPARPPLWLGLAAACFLLYFGVLFVAEFQRPEPSGLHAGFEGRGAEVASVAAGSPAERAGLRPGDRILTLQGRPVPTRMDWYAVNANLRPGEPVGLLIERDGNALTTTFTPGQQRFVPAMAQPDRIALLAARAVQFACLVLAVFVCVRRPDDGLARLATWVLASFGVFTIVFPYGFAHNWRLVPGLFQPLLWFPYVSSFSAPAIFFVFCTRFPGTLAGMGRWLLALCAPAALLAAWYAYVGVQAVYREARVPVGVDWSRSFAVLNFAYLLAGLVVLAMQYRRLDQLVNRRRLRVLLAGASVGFAAGGVVTAMVWVGRNPQFTSSLFASPVTLVAVPLLVALPASMAYTILRHRPFGIGLIVRLGVRHAMARGLLVSLVPLLAAAIALDLLLHQDRSIGEMLRLRGWLYAAIGGALVALLVNRRRWLEMVDRRFFHEHYRAEQILQDVAEQLRHANEPGEALAAVVQQVDRALQPAYVGAMGSRGDGEDYALLAANSSFPGALHLQAGSRLIALASAIRRPLDLSPDQDAWISRHLPSDEAVMVVESELELLVPVTIERNRGLVLALGPRRSEEPYSGRDTDLLRAISSNLALVLERSGPPPEDAPGLAECPACGECFDTSLARCPHDGALLLVSGIPPVLGGRYRLESRIGAGGMGTIYGARDTLLDRRVAIKVLGEHLVGSPEAARRFRREAQTSASFTHPHVVTIHDFGVTEGNRAFLVMERLWGRTLREEITRHGPMSSDAALSIVSDVCDVLAVAHGRGLVHRDLKPENVFLAETGGTRITKVLDFGIATFLATASRPTGTGTGTGVLMGSLPYMPPEQLRGEPPSPAWDLWALAVTSLEMLTGDLPGTPEGFGSAGCAPPGATSSGSRVASAAQAFFEVALAKDPQRRPATPREFRERLAVALRGE